MSGAGISPAGTSPYGFGTPDAAPIQGGSLFRDPLTGATLDGRRIDAATGDMVIDSYGRATGATAGQQTVLLALKTNLGSSAVTALGQELLAIKEIGADFKTQVQNKILGALQSAIARGTISRVTVDVQSSGSRGFAVVRWFDETTKREESLTL